MHVGTTGRRIPAGYLWGAFLVLAWAALTAVAGGGEARADDEPPKPLSGLTSLVGDTVGEVVTPVVKTTTAAAAEVAAPVVETAKTVVSKTSTAVAAAPVVAEPVAEVVAKAGGTVDKVEKVVSEAPVSAIVAPVTDAVRSVPVLGGVLDELGAVQLIDEVTTGADEVLNVVPPVLGGSVRPVVEGVQPSAPDVLTPVIPETDLPPAPPADSPAASAAALEAEAEAEAAAAAAAAKPVREAAAFAGTLPSRAPTVAAPQTLTNRGTDPSPEPGGASNLPPGVAASSAAGGNGGPAPGASSDGPPLARLFDGTSTRASIPTSTTLPPSPAGSPDVSPD